MKRITGIFNEQLSRSLTIHQWMLLSSAFSIFLLLCRIAVTHHLTYAFLIWNLLLAWIPYFISNWLGRNMLILKTKIKPAVIIFFWLLFMPNTFYIITDLFHLGGKAAGHQWLDLTIILSFAWTGILLGMISIRRMEMILSSVKGKIFSSVVVCFVMWLNAFGIYIGRYLRFNSWDVITNPFSLFDEIFSILFNPFDHRWVWAMTICFSLFMLMLYYTIRKLSDAFH
jgi:uncharacterized membrane protein